MDEQLKLAEAYYAVANDLRCNAHVMNNMADQLFAAGDRLASVTAPKRAFDADKGTP